MTCKKTVTVLRWLLLDLSDVDLIDLGSQCRSLRSTATYISCKSIFGLKMEGIGISLSLVHMGRMFQ